MRVGSGEFTYEWIEHWVRIPETETGKANGRTHGIAVAGNGDVIVFNQAQPAVLRYSADGKLKNAWGDRFAGAHGCTLVMDGDKEVLWLTDQHSAEVVKTSLDGTTLMNIERAPAAVYKGTKKYAPTWVSVNEERHGGNGDIWVTDGYGSHYIHRYSKAGAYVNSINGTEGKAGGFSCPHGIMFVPKAGGSELYIADRSNKRVQVYDAEGTFKRAFGSDYLHSPCGFVHRNGVIYCPELYGRLAVIDANDKLITYLGDQPGIEKVQGWPNLPAAQIHAGKFNSPHGMAVAPNGDLYVGEWIVGGRVTKLVRV